MRPGTSSPASLSPSVLAWLRCFDATARCGSFTRAAHELHVSQSAVSQQVKKLEDWLGHALMRRTGEGLVLTPDGERLLPTTRASFGELSTAVHRLRDAALDKPVNLVCSPSFAMLWLTLRLGDFYGSHPHTALRIVGELDPGDAACLARDDVAGSVRLVPGSVADDAQAGDLFDEWLVPVATPAFLQSHPGLRDVRDLPGQSMLHGADPEDGSQPTQDWARWLAATGIDVQGSALRLGTQFNLSQLAVQAALGSQGIAMARAALVVGYLLQGRLVVPFKQRVHAGARYRFIGHPSHPETPALKHWLVHQAWRFRQQQDALFEQAGIVPA